MELNGRKATLAVSVVVLAGWWAVLIYELGAQWSVYPHYNYGWFVPLLMLALLWRRWETRPAPVPAARSGRAMAWAVALAIAFFPTRVLQEANPIWRLVSGAMALEIIGITWCVIYWMGGWSWFKHFSFPIAFFLVAVPWPSQQEVAIIQTFTQLDVAATVSALGWDGIAAFPHGNVIEVSRGLVGIDEACSGVRSFQATLMISMLMGEWFRLRAIRRLGLVVTGVALAFVCNLARTFLLVWVCARQGPEEMEKWHDPAGVGILLGCFLGQWLLAFWWREKNLLPVATPIARVTPEWPRLPARTAMVALGIWLLLACASTEAWFRAHEIVPNVPVQWTVQWPMQREQFQQLKVSDRVRSELRYDEGKSACWVGEGGSQWRVYYFRWYPAKTLRDRMRVQFAKTHRPEKCLPPNGMILQKDLGFSVMTINKITLPFHNYLFDDRGRSLRVSFCVWEEGTQGKVPGNQRHSAWERLQAALTGNRSLGQRVLEVAVWDMPDAHQAELALADELSEVIGQK